MIFATTGTQLAFPRLMTALQALAADLDEPIVAQVGPEPGAAAAYPALDICTHLTPAAYAAAASQARVLVAHAGIGTVLTARTHAKPLIVMPRRFALREHRNDHQLATARHLARLSGIYVAWETEDLAPLLRRRDLEPASDSDPGGDRAALTAFIRDWIAA